ncbi:MAG: InlB B-repeat-containing protein, partial [Clostridia bacterium]|nr:InlB B-repeat-containing protein [Clostridia bacterium]
MKTSKKLLSILLTVIMVMTVIAPAAGFTAAALDVDPGESSEATGAYSYADKRTEYFNDNTGGWKDRSGATSISGGFFTSTIRVNGSEDLFAHNYVQGTMNVNTTHKGMIAQVHLTITGAKSTSSSYVRLLCWNGNDSSQYTYTSAVTISFTEGTEFVVNIPISDSILDYGKISTCRLEVNQLTSTATTGTMKVGFIHIGPPNEAPWAVTELTYDNLFNFNSWRSSKSATLNTSATGYRLSITATDGNLTTSNGKIIVTTGASGISGATTDVRTDWGASSDYYFIPVGGSTTYKLSYNVQLTSGGSSQIYCFIYNSSKATITSDGGTTYSSGVLKSWYDTSSGDKSVTFTTTANTRYIQFRFGNRASYNQTSTFSNIRLVNNTAPYSQATYSAAGILHTKSRATVGSFSTPARTGYNFSGWWSSASGGSKWSESTIESVATDQVMYSRWSNKILTITLNPNGGSGGTTTLYLKYATGWYSNSGATTSISSITKPNRTGYTFAGYSGLINSSGSITAANTAYTASTTVSASWTPNVYTITLNPNGGSGGTTAIYEKYATGWYSNSGATTSISSITKPTRTGYTFAGYSGVVNSSGTITAGNTAYTGNTTVNASWTANTYKVTLNNQSATTAGTTQFWFKYNTVTNGNYYYTDSACTTPLGSNSYTITLPTKTGYTFGGYYTDTG